MSACEIARRLKCTTRRRSWDRKTVTKSTRNVAVGTVKKSIETRSLAWLFKNAFHVDEGGLRQRTMYLDTLLSATSIPSFFNSP